jgi:hypothetical protein
MTEPQESLKEEIRRLMNPAPVEEFVDWMALRLDLADKTVVLAKSEAQYLIHLAAQASQFKESREWRLLPARIEVEGTGLAYVMEPLGVPAFAVEFLSKNTPPGFQLQSRVNYTSEWEPVTNKEEVTTK